MLGVELKNYILMNMGRVSGRDPQIRDQGNGKSNQKKNDDSLKQFHWHLKKPVSTRLTGNC